MTGLSLVSQGLALQAASIGQTYKEVCGSCGGSGRSSQDDAHGFNQTGGCCGRCAGGGFIEFTEQPKEITK